MSGAAVLAGFGADLLLGDPRRLHPVAGFGQVALRVERRTYRPSRAAGLAHLALLAGGAAAIGRLAEGPAGGRAARAVRRGRAVVALGVALWAALGGRSLGRAALLVGAHVRDGDLDAARAAVPALVGRDPAALDGPELCRAAVESVAENSVDAVVAPLLWAAVAGAPGVLAHRAVNTLDAMVGHRDERYTRFGWASARTDDLAAWPAARLTAGLAVALAPLAGGSSAGAWEVLRRDGHRHPSPNGGRAEAAFAGALGVTLGGRNVYPPASSPEGAASAEDLEATSPGAARVEDRPLLGHGPRPTPDDVVRAVRLGRAVGVAAALVAAAWRARR